MAKDKADIPFVARPASYRAWQGKMVTVQTLCWNAGGMIWYGAGNQFGWAWVNPTFDGWTKDNPKPGEADICPVMAWTGLKDIKGNDIWEGDIVKFKWEIYEHDWEESIGEVFWDNGLFLFGRNEEFAMNDSNFLKASIEVVGNIFENPELPR